MKKKKVTGLILFTLLIGGFLLYPSLKDRVEEQLLRYRVQSALKSEEYGRVRELVLKDGGINGFDWDYLALLEADIHLGNNLSHHISKLQMHGKIEILQHIVDKLGEGIEDYLVLATIDGLVLDEQLRYQLANMQFQFIQSPYYYQETIDRAMEIRGPRETVDNIYLRYLIHNGEIEQALRLYGTMEDKYKEDVLNALIPTLVQQTFYTSSFDPFTHEEMLENIDRLSSLGLSDEMFRLFLREAMITYTQNEYIQTNIDKYTYFFDNIYYRYYSNLRKLTCYAIKENQRTESYERILEEVLKDLKRDEFKAIPETEEIIAVLEGAKKVHSFLNVNKKGSIFYYDGENIDDGAFYSYDIYTGNKVEFSFVDMLEIDIFSYRNLQFSLSSVGRDYYIALSFIVEEDCEIEALHSLSIKNLLLDSDYNLLAVSDPFYTQTIETEWMNKVSNIVGDKKFYFPYSFNDAPITTSYVDEHRANFFVELDVPGLKNYHLYSIDDETYTIIHYKHDVNKAAVQYTDYCVYDNDTHELLYQVDLRQFDGLLGSCDENLYIASTVEDILIVIEAVDKKTLERTRLPFYSIEPVNPLQGGFPYSKIYRDHAYWGGH